MKKVLLTIASLAFAVPALAADKAAAGTAAAPAAAKGNDALQAVFTQFDAAWAKHDAKAIAALFADDANLVEVDGRRIQGKAEIEKDMTANFAGMMKDSTSHHTISNVRWIGKDAAFADLDAQIDGIPMPPNAPAGMAPPKFHAIALFTMKGGKWWISEARPYMLAPPPPPMAATPAKGI